MNDEEHNAVLKLLKCAELLNTNNRLINFNLYFQDKLIKYINLRKDNIISESKFESKIMHLKNKKKLIEEENRFIIIQYENICRKVSTFIKDENGCLKNI
jgi:hypothetical protein